MDADHPISLAIGMIATEMFTLSMLQSMNAHVVPTMILYRDGIVSHFSRASSTEDGNSSVHSSSGSAGKVPFDEATSSAAGSSRASSSSPPRDASSARSSVADASSRSSARARDRRQRRRAPPLRVAPRVRSSTCWALKSEPAASSSPTPKRRARIARPRARVGVDTAREGPAAPEELATPPLATATVARDAADAHIAASSPSPCLRD